MKYNIKAQLSFIKETKRLGKKYRSLKTDLKELGEDILANPSLGTDLGGGLRKIRMHITSKGKGKSGGARVITFTVIASMEEAEINLLYIYDKSERANITKEEIEHLLAANGL